MTAAFPGMRGFSTRNLKYMRQFAARCQHVEFGQQAVAQLPWGHHVVLIDKIKDAGAMEWYAQQAVQQG